MNKIKLDNAIKEGLVNRQKHPTQDLYIHNYTPKVQYDRLWDDITLQTRGLILDGVGNVVARPFGKFFNIEEHDSNNLPTIPSEPFKVFEKMDGSLGVMYWIDDTPFIATRGSFVSEQANWANLAILGYDCSCLDKNNTYLLEIIYPENRIVVNYGDQRKLVLLAIRDTKTGKELPLESDVFEVAKRYDGINEIDKLRELEEDNKEGFVILFDSGVRVKLKFKEYVRLHRIVTGVSSRSIWEYLKTGQEFDEILDCVPDEFYNWVKKVKQELTDEFKEIKHSVIDEYNNAPICETRKEFAEWAMNKKYPALLFCLKDTKDIEQLVWKIIKPKYSQPFKTEI